MWTRWSLRKYKNYLTRFSLFQFQVEFIFGKKKPNSTFLQKIFSSLLFNLILTPIFRLINFFFFCERCTRKHWFWWSKNNYKRVGKMQFRKIGRFANYGTWHENWAQLSGTRCVQNHQEKHVVVVIATTRNKCNVILI